MSTKVEISALNKSLHEGIIMSNFLISQNCYGIKFALRKDKIESVIQNDDENDDDSTKIWVGDEIYSSNEQFDAIVARLEE